VIDEHRLRGIVSLKDLLGFLHLKLDLEHEDVGPEDQGWPRVEGDGQDEWQPSASAHRGEAVAQR
jgi:hypothetical protein